MDLNEVAETKKTASVKRSKSGTWNVPNGEENASLLANSSSLHSAPKRTTSTQTLPESEKVLIHNKSSTVCFFLDNYLYLSQENKEESLF